MTKYLEWSITPDSGYQFDLTSLDIRYDRSGTGPKKVEIRVNTGAGFLTIFTGIDVDINGEDILGINLADSQT